MALHTLLQSITPMSHAASASVPSVRSASRSVRRRGDSDDAGETVAAMGVIRAAECDPLPTLGRGSRSLFRADGRLTLSAADHAPDPIRRQVAALVVDSNEELGDDAEH